MLEQTLFVFQTVPSGQNTKETLLDLCFVACQQAFDDYARPRHLRGGISVGDHTISSQLYSLPGCAFRSTGWRRRRRRRTNFAEKGDLTSNLRVRNTMHFGRLSVESAALCFHTDVVVVMVLPPDCKHVAFVKPPHPGPPQQHKILYLLLADATALVATCLFLLSFHDNFHHITPNISEVFETCLDQNIGATNQNIFRWIKSKILRSSIGT